MDDFGKWRRRLWPVHNHELVKMLPLLALKFLITFIYTILKDTKDTLIVTSANSGAEAIPVLKGWFVLPAAFLAMIAYSRLSLKVSQKNLFYIVMASFLSFFALYGYVLYPYRDHLIPQASADAIQDLLGPSRTHLVAVYRYWMNSLFFVAAELWGGFAIGMLFWGFANQINKVDEAKRFYTIYSAGGDFAIIVSSYLTYYWTHPALVVNFEDSLQKLISVVIATGLLSILIFFLFNHFYLDSQPELLTNNNSPKKKKGPKLSLKESMKYLLSSRYLLSIAIMVISYGLAFSLAEVTWKATVKVQYPNSTEFQNFMSVVSNILGWTSMLVTLFVGGGVIRRWGWRISASLTPYLVGMFTLLFLITYTLQSRSPQQDIFGYSPLYVVVCLGALLNIIGKTMKYSFFDPTKEMAYIPLDDELKVRGKAAIDVVAARFGKSGSSWIQVILIELVGAGSILGVTPYLIPFVAITLVAWVIAINKVNEEFVKLSPESNETREEKEKLLQEA